MKKLNRFKQFGWALLLAVGLSGPALAGGGHGHYGGYYHGGYYSSGDVGVALLGGLLIGGLVGYAISEDRYQTQAHTHYYRAPQPAYTYYEAPVRAAPAPAVAPRLSPAMAAEFAEPSGCLQTREYTTVLNVDGQTKDAYGTRCLKADGTWVFGPPKIAPTFD